MWEAEAGTEPRMPHELPRFARLAHSIAGRRVAVVATDDDRGYTDGESIFVPDLPGELVAAAVALQAALLASSSLEPSIMARLAGRRAMRLRYLTLEATRAAAAGRAVLPRRAGGLLAGVYDRPGPANAHEPPTLAGGPSTRVAQAAT